VLVDEVHGHDQAYGQAPIPRHAIDGRRCSASKVGMAPTLFGGLSYMTV
jgi:hypothetical protein